MNFPFHNIHILNAGIEQREFELERSSSGTNIRAAPNANDDSFSNAVVIRPQHVPPALVQAMIHKFPKFYSMQTLFACTCNVQCEGRLKTLIEM